MDEGDPLDGIRTPSSRKLRDAYVAWEVGEGMSIEENEAAERLAMASKALDRWMSQGGVLPYDWNARARKLRQVKGIK